jgi:hypothetical protein
MENSGAKLVRFTPDDARIHGQTGVRFLGVLFGRGGPDTGWRCDGLYPFLAPRRADIGTGVVLVSDPAARASSVLATAKAMSHTAMTYASRVVWFDQASGEAVEPPVLEVA